MKRSSLVMAMVFTVLGLSVQGAQLSIYDIQYTTDANGVSPHAGSTVDCSGGIVIQKFEGFRTRLFLYDPAYSTGFGGLVVKDFTGSDAFASVDVGDWVNIGNSLVEEFRGMTQLAYDSNSTFGIIGSGSVPEPIIVGDAQFSEQYEAMMVQLNDVTITQRDLGKAGDNYNLHNTNGDYWAADYMNVDAEGYYHELSKIGKHFESISGLLEQYTNDTWDYYQMITLSNDSFVVPEPATVALMLAGFLVLRKKTGQTAKKI